MKAVESFPSTKLEGNKKILPNDMVNRGREREAEREDMCVCVCACDKCAGVRLTEDFP